MEGQLDTVDRLDSRQFHIAIRRLADSLSYGTDKSPFLGSGVEYVQSRQYQPGDPVRTIDWRVTARIGRPYVKEFEPPRRMPCWILLDTSASMTVSSVRKSKYAIAVHLAGGLAYACLDRVSPVGLLAVGERDLRITPSLSQQQVLQWLHKLRRHRFDEGTTLAAKVTELSPLLESRSLVIVLSDLYDDAAPRALKLLAQRHDVVALQLRDPAEDGLRGGGFLRAREAETGAEFATRARRRFQAPEALARALKRAGIDHMLIPTERPFAHRLRQFFGSRNLLGKGAR